MDKDVVIFKLTMLLVNVVLKLACGEVRLSQTQKTKKSGFKTMGLNSCRDRQQLAHAGAFTRSFSELCLRGGVAAILAIALAACSGGDGGHSDRGSANQHPPEVMQDHESKTDELSDAAKTALASVSPTLYQRPYEYPHMVNLPPQFVTMSTGKKLSVRVSLPAFEKDVPAPGSFPVILTQSGYNTNLLSLLFLGLPGNLLLGSPDYFMVKRGYVQVAVDALGTGASEGGWQLFGEEEQAGFADMVDWVHQQEWSNGKLGVAGVSYMAISALFAAQHRPENVDAVFASLPLGDAMRGIAATGGLLNGHFFRTWMMITHTLATQNIPTMLAYPQHTSQLMRSTQEHVDHLDAYLLPLIEDAMQNEAYVSYDGDFWQQRSPLRNIDKIKAPTFLFGALDDLFQRDEPLLFEALKKNGVDSRLVIYDGFHFPNFLLSHIGNAQVPPVDYLMLQWFDHYLKGLDTGIANIPQVVQEVKNYPTPSTPAEFRNDSYVTATDWPHPQATPERWYLRGEARLSPEAPDKIEQGPMMLEPEPPSVRAYRSGALLAFELGINDGTVCSRSFEQWILGLALPKPCYYNTDGTTQQRIVFDSEPMAEDYFINGPIQADIWIASTAADAVVAVQIEEVSSRKSTPITNGQLLASMRAVDTERSRFLQGEMIQPYHYLTKEQESLLVPGEVTRLQIEIFPTSAIVRKGNRLRVSVSPSNQAQGMLNYPRQELTAGGVTTLHIAPEHPSSIVLPVVPLSAMN